jgi:hypothetical protein
MKLLRRAAKDVGVTSDRSDPRLTHGVDEEPQEQAEVYLVLSADERAKGWVRPFRNVYVHSAGRAPCGKETRMGTALAETYARDYRFYGSTWCCTCQMHRPVGIDGEFTWLDGSKVGT